MILCRWGQESVGMTRDHQGTICPGCQSSLTWIYPRLGKPFRTPNQLAGSIGPRYSKDWLISMGCRLVLLEKGCREG